MEPKGLREQRPPASAGPRRLAHDAADDPGGRQAPTASVGISAIVGGRPADLPGGSEFSVGACQVLGSGCTSPLS
jgi:hypothetical protein